MGWILVVLISLDTSVSRDYLLEGGSTVIGTAVWLER